LLKVVSQLVGFIYARCDCILVQSQGFIPQVMALGGSSLNIKYFPNWAESFYHPVKVQENSPERDEFPNGFRILFAGNIGNAQSFETLLDAADRLTHHPEIHWVIIGDGHRRAWLEEQILLCNLMKTVHVLGRRSSESMPRYFSIADVLFVSLRKNPAFAKTIPSKVQSYLACGRPVIGSLEGEGAKVIEQSGAGIVCEPGNGESLANAALTLSRTSKEERTLMGKKGRLYYESHFQRDMLIEKLEELFLQTTLKKA